MVNKVFFPALAILMTVTACGTETSSDGGTDIVVDPYGDPPGYSGDPFAGYGPINSIELPAYGETPPVATETGVWSVQVAACATEESALELADALESISDEPVFIDHIGSYYKVRIGAFETPEETSELRNRLRSGSYPDAWSVEREPTP